MFSSATTPLNNRGLKHRPPPQSHKSSATTPLNNRGLKPQDIVCFAVLSRAIPQFTLIGTKTKNPRCGRKSRIGGLSFVTENDILLSGNSSLRACLESPRVRTAPSAFSPDEAKTAGNTLCINEDFGKKQALIKKQGGAGKWRAINF